MDRFKFIMADFLFLFFLNLFHLHLEPSVNSCLHSLSANPSTWSSRVGLCGSSLTPLAVVVPWLFGEPHCRFLLHSGLRVPTFPLWAAVGSALCQWTSGVRCWCTVQGSLCIFFFGTSGDIQPSWLSPWCYAAV